jgi:hypothetical protein
MPPGPSRSSKSKSKSSKGVLDWMAGKPASKPSGKGMLPSPIST